MVTLRLHHREAPVGVLGPGNRAVVWVQGCPFRCPGCMTPDSLDFEGGYEIAIEELAQWVFEQEGIEGVTFSGGDPMAHAAGLSLLVDAVRQRRDLGVMCYTGFTLEYLEAKGTPEQRAFLERIDLLVDGPYVQALHADLLWRGSSNQRLILLTNRYRMEVEKRLGGGDRSDGLEVFLTLDGRLCVAGVPPEPHFDLRLSTALG
jgi:anaerobic ribonucleoside-triphosphate reductase activating protein